MSQHEYILRFGKLKPGNTVRGQFRFVASTALPEVDISLLSHRDIGFIMKGVFLNFGSNVSLLFIFFFCFLTLTPAIRLLFLVFPQGRPSSFSCLFNSNFAD